MTPVVLTSALMEDYIDFNIRVWQLDNGYYTEQKYKRNMQQLQRFYSSYKSYSSYKEISQFKYMN